MLNTPGQVRRLAEEMQKRGKGPKRLVVVVVMVGLDARMIDMFQVLMKSTTVEVVALDVGQIMGMDEVKG